MAGSYANVPDTRMAWDIDGSTAVRYTTGAITTMSSGDKTILNNESSDGFYIQPQEYFAIVFPEKRDISGIFVNGMYASLMAFEYSLNTTNGQDGTWSSISYSALNDSVTSPSYRTAISAQAISAARGIRFRNTHGSNGQLLYSWHIYGKVSAGQTVHYLEYWHPTLDQRLDGAALDFGDVSRGSTETRQFRIKNASPTKTASNILLTETALTDTTPTSLSPQHLLSADGGSTYATSVTLLASPGYVSNLVLAPGQISPIVYIKRTTSASAQLGLYSLRIAASADFA